MMGSKAKKESAWKDTVARTLIGIAIVVVVFQLSARSDRKGAYQILDRTTTYIIEQSNRYSLIRLSSESKSLTRLLEGCKFIDEKLSRKSGPVTQEDLREYVRANYLTGVLLLDENGRIVSEYSKDENRDYLREEYLKNDSLLETARYPKKQYAVRYACENGDELDMAAICRTDAPGMIVVYYHTLKEYKESFSLNMKALLEGFTMEKSGTIVLSDGNSIIASNEERFIGKKPDEIAMLHRIHGGSSNQKVVAAKDDDNGIPYCLGLMKQGRDVFVYAFMPEREIYRDVPGAVFVVLALYLFALGLFDYTSSRVAQGYREEQLKLKEEYAKHLEEKNTELQIAVDKANRANAAKSNFLSRMSHDIRTPINGIVGLIKINRDHFEDRELVLGNFDKMQVAADHLLSLINDILQMSKIEDGTVKLTHEFVDFKELAFGIHTMIAERAAESGITLDFKMGKTSNFPNVYGSPVHLRQIFLNIYTNSIKYNRPGGVITTMVDVTRQSEERCTYQWTIEDTGIGMDEEFMKHLFEPFTQEKEDARTYYQGVGLGMSIVKGLLDEMGGTISVTSQVGVGTTFVITIPFEIAHQENANPQTQSEKTGDITGLHLLMAEDNELNAEIAKTVLEDAGAKITVVSDGKQAVEALQNHAPGTFDAIIMDIMMPVMDGLAATRAIRALDHPDAKTIPIIAMTANAFAEDAEKCLAAGMNAHLAKPLDIQKVVETIAQCVGNTGT